MYRHLFRNRWIALAFVLMMASSAASLVGTEDGGGMIDQAKEQLQGQKDQFEAEAAKMAKPTRSHTVISLEEPPVSEGDMQDEEALIDPGTGIDPTPPDPAGLEPEPDINPAPVG